MTDAEFLAWLETDSAVRVALVDAQVHDGVGERTLRLASKGYTTDTHIGYEPCIIGGIPITERLNFDGSASSAFGDIEIDNTAGDRDHWLHYVWANRPITVRLGDMRWPVADFRVVFEGVVADIVGPRSRLALSMLSKLDRLNHPALSEKLGGTGENADRLIPAAFGEVHNCEPLLVSNDQHYRFHTGAGEDVFEVRDNGAPRTDITKSLATGGFQITGTAVVGRITATVQGAKPGGAFTRSIAPLVQHLVTAYGPADLRFTAADIDTANFAAFASANPQPVGLWVDDEATVLTCAQRLSSSVGAQVLCTALGKLRLVRLGLPSAGSPDVFTEHDMVEGSLVVAERTAVRAAVKLGYCPNWTRQDSGMATGLPPSSADLFKEEWLTVSATDSATAALYRLSTDVKQEDTLLLTKAAADAETARRLALWGVTRTVYEADFFPRALLKQLGDDVVLRHPRLGLSAGKPGIVVSRQYDLLTCRVRLGIFI